MVNMSLYQKVLTQMQSNLKNSFMLNHCLKNLYLYTNISFYLKNITGMYKHLIELFVLKTEKIVMVLFFYS